MSRYIDADKLLKMLDVFSAKEGTKADFFTRANLVELASKYNHGQYCYENVKEIVESTSAAKVREIKYGKWLEHFAYGSWHYDCPFCGDGYATMRRDRNPQNYCGNCGADMRGVEE